MPVVELAIGDLPAFLFGPLAAELSAIGITFDVGSGSVLLASYIWIFLLTALVLAHMPVGRPPLVQAGADFIAVCGAVWNGDEAANVVALSEAMAKAS